MFQKVKAKQILADKDKIREIVLKTMDDMAAIVGSSLGPGGSSVIIERDGLSPLVSKDGLTIAKAIGVSDAAANTIIEAAKEICINTARDAGDGTTTAIVLANAIVKNGHEFLKSNPKYNPQRVINELNNAYNTVVVPYIRQVAIETKNEEQLLSVATISANGDTDIASSVVKAVMAAGDDGTVLISESQGRQTSVETLDGYVVTTGLKELGSIGPLFINDKAGQQVLMDDGYVVLYDGTINDLKVPSKIQDAVADQGGFSDGTPIIVFAHGFADSVVDKFAKTTKGGLTVIPVKTPRSGLPNGASMFLHDMAAYTGGEVYDAGNLDDMDSEDFGRFDSAKINMYESFIMGSPSAEDVSIRVTELKAIMESAFSEMDKSFLRASIAKLTGGVSTIYVGGSSDLEIREKKGRVEDAVEAVRSAIAEGIVAGGCSTHLRLIGVLESHPERKDSWGILSKALMAPFTLLLSNCGENPEEVYELLLPNFDKVFDANLHEVVDPIATGIIEPAKVIRVSLGNALSVASLLTTLSGIVVVPRNADMEGQLELAGSAFKSMMSTVEDPQ